MSIAAKDIVSTFDQGSCGSNIITFCVKIFSCPIIALDNKVPKETSYLLPGLKVGMHCHCARLIFTSVFGGYTDQSWIISSLICVSSRDTVSTFDLCDCENLFLLNVKLHDSKVTNETSYLLPLCKLLSKLDIYIVSSSDQYSRQRHCFHI